MYLVRKFVTFWEDCLSKATSPRVARSSRRPSGRPTKIRARHRRRQHHPPLARRVDPRVRRRRFRGCRRGLARHHVIASLEGAVVLCRSTRSVDPLREVACQIEFLIKSREFVRLYGLPTANRG